MYRPIIGIIDHLHYSKALWSKGPRFLCHPSDRVRFRKLHSSAACKLATEVLKLHILADMSHGNCMQAGQVWFPDSALKTAQAMEEFELEGLPLMVMANWRGFSGGQRDLFEGVLQVFSKHTRNNTDDTILLEWPQSAINIALSAHERTHCNSI